MTNVIKSSSYCLYYRSKISSDQFAGSLQYSSREDAESVLAELDNDYKSLYHIEIMKVQHIERRRLIRLVDQV